MMNTWTETRDGVDFEVISYSCAETAKFVRAALKRAFPAERFSVRSHTYAGGASIDIHPSRHMAREELAAVDQVCRYFAGATFDGMIDSMNYHRKEWDGKPAHFGADFVFVQN